MGKGAAGGPVRPSAKEQGPPISEPMIRRGRRGTRPTAAAAVILVALLVPTGGPAGGVEETPRPVTTDRYRALAHVVGTGNSGGCWDYGGLRERASAYDLVEWLGTRPWSNGRVGMVGGSYDGTTANMAAVADPPHLATIVPEVAIGQWYGYAYHDGVRYTIMDPGQRQGLVIDEQGFDTPAAFDFALALAPPLNPADPDYARRTFERLCPEGDKALHTERGYDAEPDFGAFWQERSYLREAREVDVPVLVQSGWRDYNVKFSESTRWFESLPRGVPRMLVMDQVDHGTPSDPGFRWEKLLHAWFDRYLYGLDTNVEAQPRVLSKANDGAIRAASEWPPPSASRE